MLTENHPDPGELAHVPLAVEQVATVLPDYEQQVLPS